MWNNVIGQQRVKRILQTALENEKLPGAYLFYGPEGTGKDATAFELAKAINCERSQSIEDGACDDCDHCLQIDAFTSPLLHFLYALAKDVEPGEEPGEKGEDLEILREQLGAKSEDHYYNLDIPRATAIQVGQIRSLRMALSRSMSGGKRRVVIISEADMMNAQAQNAFLKTLEEPHANTLIVLTSSNINRLYPTILSRCQEVRFDVLQTEELTEALIERDELPRAQAEFLARLSNGSYSQAKLLIGEDLHSMRAEIVGFLRMGLSRSRRNAALEIDRFLPRGSGGKFLEKRLAVEQRLALLALWLRDALAITIGSPENVLNHDQREDLERFVTRFGDPQKIIAAVRAVERAQSLTRQQLQLRPVMLELVMDLEEALV